MVLLLFLNDPVIIICAAAEVSGIVYCQLVYMYCRPCYIQLTSELGGKTCQAFLYTPLFSVAYLSHIADAWNRGILFRQKLCGCSSDIAVVFS